MEKHFEHPSPELPGTKESLSLNEERLVEEINVRIEKEFQRRKNNPEIFSHFGSENHRHVKDEFEAMISLAERKLEAAGHVYSEIENEKLPEKKLAKELERKAEIVLNLIEIYEIEENLVKKYAEMNRRCKPLAQKILTENSFLEELQIEGEKALKNFQEKSLNKKDVE